MTKKEKKRLEICIEYMEDFLFRASRNVNFDEIEISNIKKNIEFLKSIEDIKTKKGRKD